MQLVYIEHLNGYVDLESKYYPGDIYSDDDLDFLLQLESQYRKNIPEYSFYELINIYPSAKNAMKRGLVQKEKALKEKKKKYLNYIEETQSKIFGKMDGVQTSKIKDELAIENEIFLNELKKEQDKIKFQKQYLNRLVKQEKLREKITNAKTFTELEKAEKELEEINYKPSKGITIEMIEYARNVPIANFIKVGRDGKVNCFKHNEKTPSMHIYKKKNNFYCFSCGYHGSVIDIVMELQGLDFKGAVKYLNNI